MDIARVVLDKEHAELLEAVSCRMASVQESLNVIMSEYQAKNKELDAIKEKIRPLRRELSPLAEYQSAIASRKSRAKYFPEFATRNFNDSKDNEFLEFVKAQIK